MAKKFIHIGSARNVFAYDDGVQGNAIETEGPIKCNTPSDPAHVVRLEDLPALTTLAKIGESGGLPTWDTGPWPAHEVQDANSSAQTTRSVIKATGGLSARDNSSKTEIGIWDRTHGGLLQGLRQASVVLNIVGDSNTFRVEDPSPPIYYQQFLQKWLARDNFYCINQGVSGDKASDILTRYTRDIANLYQADAINKLLICVGINDAVATVTAANYYADLETVIDGFQTLGGEVFVCLYPPKDGDATVSALITEYNTKIVDENALRATADRFTIIDLNSLVSANGVDWDDPAFIHADTYHWLAPGQLAIAEFILGFVNIITLTKTSSNETGRESIVRINQPSAGSAYMVGQKFKTFKEDDYDLTGSISGVELVTEVSGAGDVSEIRSLAVQPTVNNAGAVVNISIGGKIYPAYIVDGVVNYAGGIRIFNTYIDPAGSGAVHTQYGVLIDDMTSGDVANYPIYCNGGGSYHAGTFDIAGCHLGMSSLEISLAILEYALGVLKSNYPLQAEGSLKIKQSAGANILTIANSSAYTSTVTVQSNSSADVTWDKEALAVVSGGASSDADGVHTHGLMVKTNSTNWLDLTDSGVTVLHHHKNIFQGTLSTPQPIAASGQVIIIFDGHDYEDSYYSYNHTTGYLTINTAGEYKVTFCAPITDTAAVWSTFYPGVVKNTSTTVIAGQMQGYLGEPTIVKVLTLAANDTLRCVTYRGTADGYNVEATALFLVELIRKL